MVFIQVRCIYNKYQKGCTIVCRLHKNLVICLIYLMLLKDQRFGNYMIKYNKEKVNKEIDKLISGLQLQKQIINISLKSFEIFLYIDVDKNHWRYIPFTQTLFSKYADSSDIIRTNLNDIGNGHIFLDNNTMELIPLEDQTISQCHCALSQL